MEKILIQSIVLMMILLVSGCSTKTEYVYIKPKPFSFQTTQQPKVREIRVYKGDKKLYKAYIVNFRKIINFHNMQIEDYRKSFDTNETK